MKVIIIGAGVSGLVAGIYALKAGFETEIYESHNIVGGLCTGWQRKGYNIDGCVHWLTGTKKGSDLYEIWKNCGVLDNDTDVIYHKYIASIRNGNEYYYLYAHLEEMEAELLRISPDDADKIREMVDIIKVYQKLPIPANKPDELMGLFEKLKFYFPYIKDGKYFSKFGNMSAADYANGFRSPIIKKLLTAVVPDNLTANAFFYTWATFSTDDGGWPVGGSLEFAHRMKQKFESLGGTLHLNSKVEKIVIQNRKATGIRLKNKDSVIPADYIIPATDVRVLLYDLLEGKYADEYFTMRYANPQKYDLLSSTIISLGVDTDLSQYPYNVHTSAETPITINQSTFTDLFITHYGYDKKITPEGKTIIEVLLNDTEFDYWNKLKKSSKNEYNDEKERIAISVIKEVEKVYPEIKGKIEMVDVATPLTFHRYCGSYQGSYMAFITTSGVKPENHKGTIAGIKNMYLAGQWALPQGGLPMAAIAGKFAVQRICKQEKRPISL